MKAKLLFKKLLKSKGVQEQSSQEMENDELVWWKRFNIGFSIKKDPKILSRSS
jgi:hypothetical protein